eukprot:1491467-Rhodomonas_salina.1
MEDEDSGLISHLEVEEGVNWRPFGSKVLDTFYWLTKNTGSVHLLEKEMGEGFCRCLIRRGIKCGPDCEMVKASAECAGSSHLGKDCGNKEVGKMKKKGNWPSVHLDVFPGMGLGLRATKYIAAGEVVGPYYGRVKSMPKRQSRRGHHYLVDMDNEVILDASREGSLMRYVNSSCEPNVRFIEKIVEGSAELFYVSLRAIVAGEDITTAYGDGLWNGKCLCRKPGCLGSISKHKHE